MKTIVYYGHNLIKNMQNEKMPHQYWRMALKKLQHHEELGDEEDFTLLEMKVSELNQKLYYDHLRLV